MLRPQVPSAPDGQGLFVQWKRGLAGHMGGDDGVRTFVFFDPATRVGAVVLVNQDGPRATAAAVEAVRQTLRNPRLAAALGAGRRANALTRRPCGPTLAALDFLVPDAPAPAPRPARARRVRLVRHRPLPYAGIIEVSLARDAEGGAGLLLVAVDDTGCNNPLAVETDATPARLDVRVVGIVPPERR